jgi:hypothetical protein
MDSGSAISAPSVVLAPPRRRPRPASLLARLRAHRIDRELAQGTEPWRSPVYAARSLQLTSPRNRRALAKSLDRLVRDADASRAGFANAAITPCREQVLRAIELIRSMAARLRSPEPLNVQGVARLNLLLSDGEGPCYRWLGRDSLLIALRDVSQWLPVRD